MHFLVVKKGALGDVVRTSYFAKALKDRFGNDLRLSWITALQGAMTPPSAARQVLVQRGRIGLRR
jgi:hypothetical protein